MKIVAFSDLHLKNDCLRAILSHADQADLVLGAGDYAENHKGLDTILSALAPVADKTILVPGNNETEQALRDGTDAIVLHGDSVVRDGLTIAGLGAAVPPLPPMPWNSFDLTEDEAEGMLGQIGAADILISHSPPKGVGDQHSDAGSIGSVAVRRAVERLQPRWLLCGHVHDRWGMRGMIGATTVANLGPVPVLLEIDT